MPSGRALEQLVANLEKILADNRNVVVESPKRLPDSSNRSLREHDVVVTVTQGHHVLRIAIECRDHSRPVTVNQVEAFLTKCRDTGIDQGVMVSTSGYSENAWDKARRHDIRLLDMEQARSFSWLLAPGIYQAHTKVLHSHWLFYPAKPGVIESREFEIVDQDGNLVPRDILHSNAARALREALPEILTPVEEAEMLVRFLGRGLSMRCIRTGGTVPVDYATARIRYSVVVELKAFNLVHYVDKGRNQTISDVAVADIDAGIFSGQVLLVHKDGVGAKVMFVSKETEKK